MYDRLGVAPDRIVPTGSIGSKGIAFAAGEVDALVSLHPHVGPWDWAPGKVILEEIGFQVSHLTGQPLTLGGDALAAGYLVCPREHEARFVQGLGWLHDRLRRRSRSALLLAA
jgi:fructose-1,6-bisphosphatase/inositol monophosphatase family enzyme